MVYLILIALTFFIQLFASVWLVMVETQKGKKSALKFRFLCSSIFIADVLLCAAMQNAHRDIYFILILAGAFISFVGDILGNASDKADDCILLLCHSVSNCIYTAAFIRQQTVMFGSLSPKALSILSAIPIGIFLVPFMCKKTGKFKISLIFSVFSSLFLISSAIYLGIHCQLTGEANMQSASCSLIIGSLAIGLSQLLCTRQQISPPPALKPQLPRHCMYLFGQMMIACSIIIGG